jgi:hypothetical protein
MTNDESRLRLADYLFAVTYLRLAIPPPLRMTDSV